ncbi:tyrosine-type recombinase/integrase [Thalassotalea sp. G2M2-11]|uniref:tyrosine-type recombinase/integrase n=1 Tax=Thalassotalea sp. G2M2-11 TaxID=2787627 RepID=UPI0019CFBEA1|nr:tyrosine-type recombinase/integrase [Thalassotalea sp. G2M2-11]
MAEKKKSKKKKIHKEEAIESFIDKGKRGIYYVAANLYLKVTSPKIGSWFVRVQYKKKRYEKKVAAYGKKNPYLMDYQGAIDKSVEVQRAVAAGQNPLERDHVNVFTLNQLHNVYLNISKYKYEKQQKIYSEYFAENIGEKLLYDLTRKDVEDAIKAVADTGYSSIANKGLYYLRSIFKYAHIHRFTIENIADHLDVEQHAGGSPKSRNVHLSEREISKIFEVFEQYPQQATLDNKIAIALYLIFGSRKSELLKSKWTDFDFERKEWTVYPTKMGEDRLIIDVPNRVMNLFWVLKARSKSGNPYMFPTKGNSKSGHLSESTLNHMLSKFFGQYKTHSVTIDNPLGKANVQKFTVHDLRRTFKTSASDNEASDDVTERCLNHKKRKGKKVYDLSTRQSERKKVYKMMSKIVMPLTRLESDIKKYERKVELIKEIVLPNKQAA